MKIKIQHTKLVFLSLLFVFVLTSCLFLFTDLHKSDLKRLGTVQIEVENVPKEDNLILLQDTCEQSFNTRDYLLKQLK